MLIWRTDRLFYWFDYLMYQSHTPAQRKSYLNLPEDYTVDICIIYGSWKVEEYTKMLLATAQSFGLSFVVESSPDRFTQYVQVFRLGEKRIWFLVEYGGVRLSEYLDLACQFGSKMNLFLGSCGGLKLSIQSCDIIVPTYSYGDESSTRLYNRTGDKYQYSNETLSKKIVDELYSLGITIHEGPIMTCAAMLAETQEDVDTRSEQGYYGVEMESSTVFAVSNQFSVPSAGLIYVSDNLVEGQTVMSDDYRQQQESRITTIKHMFTVVLREVEEVLLK